MPEIREKGGITGTVTIRRHPAGTIAKIESLLKAGNKLEAQMLLKTGEIAVEQKNLVVHSLNYGSDILVQFLISSYIGSFAFPLGIAWGEIGTGNTAPANTDTALTTPTNRTSVSYAADLGYNEAQLQFFFPDATLANTTFYEAGCFVGGTASIGTGNLFNHALFSSPYSKSGGTDTTLEIDFSFS